MADYRGESKTAAIFKSAMSNVSQLMLLETPTQRFEAWMPFNKFLKNMSEDCVFRESLKA